MIAAPCREVLSLRPGVHTVTSADGARHLILWPHTDRIGVLNPEQEAALHRLASAPCTVAGLRAEVRGTRAHDGTSEASGSWPHDGVVALVRQLRGGGWLRVTVTAPSDSSDCLDSEYDTPLYTLEPLRATGVDPAACAPLRPTLSRFAALTPSDGELVVGVPHGACDVRLHDQRVLAAVADLARGATAADLEARLPGAIVRRMLDDLARAGVLAGAMGEETAPAPWEWSPHELWFHARSRLGARRQLGENLGRTGRFPAPPLPAAREPLGDTTIELHRPDMVRLRATDPPFTAMLEDRASYRLHDNAHPITLAQLGEFLYRCASARERVTPDGRPYLGRPYPSGGASYELEFYPLVHRVDGLEPGLYRYDQVGHRLEVLDADRAAMRRTTGVIRTLQGTAEPPQVLIVIAARFGRVMWKYEAMAYALTLKHVGVVYEVMYLVATAMGLAPCAVGTGESGEFTAAAGLDYLSESPVGEFLLGSRLPTEGGTR